MTRDEFLVYLGHLNNKEHDKINDYITDDIVLEFFDKPTMDKQTRKVLHGRDEYIAHFKALHSKVREVMDLGFFVYNGENLVVEIYVEFHALEDVDLQSVELKKGQVFCATHFLCYSFAPDGRFNRVRIAHHMVHYTPPKH